MELVGQLHTLPMYRQEGVPVPIVLGVVWAQRMNRNQI